MYELFELVDRSSDVDTVSPPDNLVIGALYTIRLTCSDAVGNDAVSVEANQVEFAGNKDTCTDVYRTLPTSINR